MPEVATASQPARPPASREAVLRVEHIAKRFGPVVALRDVNLHLDNGDTIGLLGDNGSGKSTLIKIIAGFQTRHAGRIVVHGREAQFSRVADAGALGIECVFQDLALVNLLSVYDNLFLHYARARRTAQQHGGA